MTRNQSPATSHSWRKGFTLIELLVVIAVITLLLAILLPALSAARRISQRSKCQTNLREIARGWEMYLDENEDRFLQGANTNVNYGGKQGAILPFQKPKPLNKCLNLELVMPDGANVFLCPADEGGGTIQGRNYDFLGTSYGTNVMLIGQDQLPIEPADPCAPVVQQVNDRLRGLTRSRVTPASKVVLIGDYGWLYDANRLNPDKARWHEPKCKQNLAMLDGHVEFLRIRKGWLVAPEYHILPFSDLVGQAQVLQGEEVPCD